MSFRPVPRLRRARGYIAVRFKEGMINEAQTRGNWPLRRPKALAASGRRPRRWPILTCTVCIWKMRLGTCCSIKEPILFRHWLPFKRSSSPKKDRMPTRSSVRAFPHGRAHGASLRNPMGLPSRSAGTPSEILKLT